MDTDSNKLKTLALASTSALSLYLLYKKFFKKFFKKRGKSFHQKSGRKYSFSEPTTSTDEFTQIMIKESQIFNSDGHLEAILPREFESDAKLEKMALSRFNYSKGMADKDGLQKALLAPIYDLLDRGGKRWRPILGKIITEIFGGNWSEIGKLAAAYEIVHNGTLIADDMEDSSEFRRGKKAIHLVYGHDIATNVSSFMYVAPINSWVRCFGHKYSKATICKIHEIQFRELTNIHIGQSWDICWHREVAAGQHPIPSVDNYMEMVSNKTGVLARLVVDSVCCLLDLDEETTSKLVDFAEALGVGFQIQDDILNLVENTLAETKGGVGEDIHEGKISLIVIHSLNHSSEVRRKRLLEILSMHTEDSELIREAIGLMKESNSIVECEQMAKAIVMDAWRKVRDYLPDCPAKGKLYSFALYMVERKM